MKTIMKTLGAVALMAGAAVMVAPAANADSLQVSLNLGGPGYYYQPAPVRVVEHRVVQRPVYYHPAPVVVYRDVKPHKHWKRGHGDHRNAWRGHDNRRVAYGYW